MQGATHATTHARRSWNGLLRATGVLVVCLARTAAAAAGNDEAASARTLLLRGHYAEAQEAFDALADEQPIIAALGVADCQRAVGKYDDATKTLKAAAGKHGADARLKSALARGALIAGDLAAARKESDAALTRNPKDVTGRWVRAEVYRLTGKMDKAESAYKWFINFYNDSDAINDPDTLRTVGLGAAQYARWKRLHDQFSFLVNDLYPELLTLDENYWPAYLESGRLFLEKYNEVDAAIDFQMALELNPNAAEVHAALARLALQNYELDKVRSAIERALEINPRLLEAHWLKADLAFANFEAGEAEKILIGALPLCPTSEATLGRLAAARGALAGLPDEVAGTAMGKLIEQAKGRNAHCGDFFESLADSLDTMRRYPQAAHYYREATRVMPKLVGAYGKLGLVHLRLGEEQLGRKVLEESFDVDFGNVRIKNSLEVLDLLATYETLETEHFRIRFDPKHDAILARAMGRYLESIYPELCKKLDYFPKEKSLFEIFNRAKNTRGHGWFSARMVGLPHIHTIGACAGKIVAMVSPGDMDEKVNWARVVRHEFVHVLNLQQTNFNIPHWFTEALAVHNEGYPRPQSWNEMLARRVPKGEVFTLDTINRGFIRPSSSADWQMAYCQAELYAEYMLDAHGPKALGKMLAAYGANLDTPAAIEKALGVSRETFEKGYVAFVKKIVAKIEEAGVPSGSATERSLADLEKAVEADPENADFLAHLAIAHLRRKAYPEAGSLARKALKRQPKHPAASYVQARLQLLIGDREAALDLLNGALDRDAPQPNLLQLLAGLHMQAKEYDVAAEMYDLGRSKFPGDATWTKLLTRVYLKAKRAEKLRPLLVERAEADADDLTVRKKLATMALADKQFPNAADWATQALQIDVLDASMHRVLGEARVGQEQFGRAIAEFETAVEIAPKDLATRYALAETCHKAGRDEQARKVLTELLALDADYPGARDLLKQIDP